MIALRSATQNKTLIVRTNAEKRFNVLGTTISKNLATLIIKIRIHYHMLYTAKLLKHLIFRYPWIFDI